MKNKLIKLTSLLLVVIVAASVLYACNGSEDDVTTTGDAASEVVATTAGSEVELTTSTVSQNVIDDIVKSALGDAEWDGNYASLSQAQKDDIINEMYTRGYVARFRGSGLYVVTKEEYETAQQATKTAGGSQASNGTTVGTTNSPKVTTTAKGETTTGRKGIVPGTTAKNGIATTKKSSATTKAGSGATTKANGSASTTSSSGGSNDVGEGTITKPEVTYLDKYVVNVINTGKYTMKMVTSMDDNTTIAMTQYVDGSKYSFVGVVNYSGFKATMKFISKDGKKYLVVPLISQYAEITNEDIGDIEDDFSGMVSISEIFEQIDSWQYLGVTRITGMNIESYKDDNGTVWKFYFNSSGLQKVESVSDGTTETFNVVIESGVASSEAFTIPSGYTKTTFEEMVSAFSGIIPGA